MGQSDDIDDSTYSRHQELCQKLNMDATSASEAWRSYETIRQNYTLEVFILNALFFYNRLCRSFPTKERLNYPQFCSAFSPIKALISKRES